MTKRTPKQIERAAQKVLTFIQKNPECNAEAISAGTKMDNRLIFLPIKALLKGKVIKAKGKARGTRYTARTDGGVIITAGVAKVDTGVIIAKGKK